MPFNGTTILSLTSRARFARLRKNQDDPPPVPFHVVTNEESKRDEKTERRIRNQKKKEGREKKQFLALERHRMDEEEWRKRDETASISKSNYLFPTWCDIGTADRKTRGSADGSTVSSGLW